MAGTPLPAWPIHRPSHSRGRNVGPDINCSLRVEKKQFLPDMSEKIMMEERMKERKVQQEQSESLRIGERKRSSSRDGAAETS